MLDGEINSQHTEYRNSRHAMHPSTNATHIAAVTVPTAPWPAKWLDKFLLCLRLCAAVMLDVGQKITQQHEDDYLELEPNVLIVGPIGPDIALINLALTDKK